MAQQHINHGASPNDGTGDTLRVSQIKAESNFNELYANKVDKVVGKVLSDTNYTQAEKDQLAALVLAGGNVQSNFAEGNSANPAFILNKPVNTSDFNNDGNGIQAFVTDNPTAVPSARINGNWVSIGLLEQLEFSANGTDNFVNIGTAERVKSFFYNSVLQQKAVWSQTGNIVTFTFIPEAGTLNLQFI